MILKPSNSIARIYTMNRRDILMVLALLVLTVALTWAGTDYVVNYIVQPLVDEESAPSPSYPTP